MYLVINKCVTAVKASKFSGHYLRNRSTLDIGVSGYIGIVQHKEYSPEVLSIPPGTPCIIFLGILFSSILCTCPNQRNLFNRIVSIIVGSLMLHTFLY